MNPIYIHFESFSSKIDSKTYVEHVLKGLSDYYIKIGGEDFPFNLKDHDNLAQNICNNLTEGKVPITKPTDFPEIDAFIKKRVEVMITCAKGIIDEVAPPLSNEDDFEFEESYLSKDWKEFSKGCGVIKRKSNMATVNFIFPDTTIGAKGSLNKDFSNYPGAELKPMKRSSRSQVQDPAVKELMNSFLI